MSKIDRISRLIDLIQDAAFDETLLPRMMSCISAEFSATFASVQEDFLESNRVRLLHHTDFSDDEIKKYEQYYSKISISSKDRLRLGIGEIYTQEMFHDYDTLTRSETHNDFFRRLGMDHIIHSFLEKGTRYRAGLFIRRDDGAGRFEESDFEIFRILLPHVRQTLRMRNRMALTESRTAGLESLLNALSFGTVFLDRRGEIRFANRCASAILDEQDGLCVDRTGRLQAFDRSGDAALQQGILAVALGGVTTERTVAIARPSGKASYGVTICRPPRRDADPTAGGALLFLTDPDRNARPSAEALSGLFGLTPAEQRVAQALCAGLAPKAIAGALNVSENTVKSHLKAIFLKTGAVSQADFQRIVSALIPPLP